MPPGFDPVSLHASEVDGYTTPVSTHSTGFDFRLLFSILALTVLG